MSNDEIYVVMPNFGYEGLGEPFELQYYLTKEDAEKVVSSNKNLFYEYIILELTRG